MMLDQQIDDVFFPRIRLSSDEMRHYNDKSHMRLREITHLIESTDSDSHWTKTKSKFGTYIYRYDRAESIIYKSSSIVHGNADEILHALARKETKGCRKTMQFLFPKTFLDVCTIQTFNCNQGEVSAFSYQALKWCAFKASNRSDAKGVDFCVLEHAGSKVPSFGSEIVGFLIQESISREHEVPSLKNFGLLRGRRTHFGVLLTRLPRSDVVMVSFVCQMELDHDHKLSSMIRSIMEENVGAVHRMNGLIERQRISNMKFKEQWEWVANSERKACAVCHRLFFLRRKHHCRVCGEVVCSSCAPLRELEDAVFDITHLRICTTCISREQTDMGMNEDQHFCIAKKEHKSRSMGKVVADSVNQPSKVQSTSASANHKETYEILRELVDQMDQIRETINLTASQLEFEVSNAYCDDSTIHNLKNEVMELPRESEPDFNTSDAVKSLSLSVITAAKSTQMSGEALVSSFCNSTLSQGPSNEISDSADSLFAPFDTCGSTRSTVTSQIQELEAKISLLTENIRRAQDKLSDWTNDDDDSIKTRSFCKLDTTIPSSNSFQPEIYISSPPSDVELIRYGWSDFQPTATLGLNPESLEPTDAKYLRMGNSYQTASYGNISENGEDTRTNDSQVNCDEKIREISRRCLKDLHYECWSPNERHERLTWLAKIFRSLVSDGLTSAFVNLPYTSVRYRILAEKAPSILQLMSLSGYVSSPEGLTIFHVDLARLHMILSTIDDELELIYE